MIRLLVIAAAFVLATSILPAAPVPRDAAKPPFYFPTRVGTKWVYEEKGGEGYAEIVTNSEEKNGQHLITVKSTAANWVDDDSTTISLYTVSENGICLLAVGLESPDRRHELDPSAWLLKLPHKVGEKYKVGEKRVDPVFVIGKVETVKVPAGKFEAIRVEHGENCTVWYVPMVGAVKTQNGDIQREMKSFTLPKD